MTDNRRTVPGILCLERIIREVTERSSYIFFNQGTASVGRCAGSFDEKPDAVNVVPTYIM